MPDKDLLDINENEMLLSKDGASIIFMRKENKTEVLERLSSVDEQAKLLFKSTYTYLMDMSKLDEDASATEKQEYFKTSSLLLRTLTEIKQVCPICDENDKLVTAQSEVEMRLYGRTIDVKVNEEILDGNT